jgi:hypothetical protein
MMYESGRVDSFLHVPYIGLQLVMTIQMSLGRRLERPRDDNHDNPKVMRRQLSIALEYIYRV